MDDLKGYQLRVVCGSWINQQKDFKVDVCLSKTKKGEGYIKDYFNVMSPIDFFCFIFKYACLNLWRFLT